MKTLGNILWLIFGGFFSALEFYFLGLLLYITIIGIPLGKQCFKLGNLMLLPFGHEAVINFSAHPIANLLWLIFIGLGSCISYITLGVLLCITIIGIPFGKQWFKLATLVLIPFGATIKNC